MAPALRGRLPRRPLRPRRRRRAPTWRRTTRSATPRSQGYADDVVEICRELELDRRASSSATRCRAMIGVLADARGARRCSTQLVLIGPSPRYIDDEGYVGGFSEADIDELLESLESNYLGWSSAMAPVIMGNPDRPELGERAHRELLPHRPGGRRRASRGSRSSPTTAPTCRQVARPTLVLQCTRGRDRPGRGRPVRRRADARQPPRAAGRDRPLPEPERSRGDDRRDHGLRPRSPSSTLTPVTTPPRRSTPRCSTTTRSSSTSARPAAT